MFIKIKSNPDDYKSEYSPFLQKMVDEGFVVVCKNFIGVFLLLTLLFPGKLFAQSESTVIGQKDSLPPDSIFKSLTLKEVEIIRRKPLVKADLDKISYMIEDDPDARTSSMFEMMRKVPLVTVDADDNLKVNGSKSFKVYVNGKPNSLMTSNPREVLNTIPAATIKRVEIITNPGARYDAEGVGGVVNIVLRKTLQDGFNASINAGTSTENSSIGGSVTTKAGKLTISANADYSWEYNPRSYSGGSQKAVGEIGLSSSDIEHENTLKRSGNTKMGGISASYDIDSLRLLSASLSVFGMYDDNDRQGTTVGSNPLSGASLYHYGADSHSHSRYENINLGIDYQRSYSVKDRLLTISYRLDSRPSSNDSYSNYLNVWADESWKNFIGKLTDLHTISNMGTQEHTFQADYSTPIGKVHTIESGVKYIMRKNKSDDDHYQTIGTDNYTLDSDRSSHYRHRNDIMAAYGDYRLNLEKVQLRAGLRYEYTKQKVEYLLGHGSDFSLHYSSLVPSLSLGYQLTDLSFLRMAYNLRIQRPNIAMLDPYLDDSNPTHISQGNSRLDCEKVNSLNVNFSHYASKVNFTANLTYRFTNNSIESFVCLKNDREIHGLLKPTGTEVLYETYDNIGRNHNLSLYTNFSWSINKKTRLSVYPTVSYDMIDNRMGRSNSGWSASISGGIDQKLQHGWNMELYGLLNSSFITLQGREEGFGFYWLKINKSWFQNRLRFGITLSSFLKKYQTSKTSISNDGFTQDSWSRRVQQRVRITLSYRFGKLKERVKRTETTIINDDVKG